MNEAGISTTDHNYAASAKPGSLISWWAELSVVLVHLLHSSPCRMVVLETRQTGDHSGMSNLYLLEVAENYVMLS